MATQRIHPLLVLDLADVKSTCVFLGDVSVFPAVGKVEPRLVGASQALERA